MTTRDTSPAAQESAPASRGRFETRLKALLEERRAGFSSLKAAASSQSDLVAVLLPEPEGGGRALVGRTEAGLARRIAAATGARLEAGALVLPEIPALDAFGLRLREAGLSQGWRDERLDLVDLERPERVLTTLERALFRPIGAATRAVHLAARTRAPRSPADPVWLVGQRSRKKRIGPGRWDGLCAGMVAAGETPRAALAREAAEEAGLAADFARSRARELERLWIARPVEHGRMIEETIAHDVTLPEGWTPRAVDGEVERFEVISAEDALELVAADRMMREAALAMLLSMASVFGVR